MEAKGAHERERERGEGAGRRGGGKGSINNVYYTPVTASIINLLTLLSNSSSPEVAKKGKKQYIL